jgi:hypothetical protein
MSVFTIFPNPTTTGGFILQNSGADLKGDNVHVTILDITGKTVFKQNIVLNNNKSMIEFGNLADGVYMVTIGEERKRLQVMNR